MLSNPFQSPFYVCVDRKPTTTTTARHTQEKGQNPKQTTKNRGSTMCLRGVSSPLLNTRTHVVLVVVTFDNDIVDKKGINNIK